MRAVLKGSDDSRLRDFMKAKLDAIAAAADASLASGEPGVEVDIDTGRNRLRGVAVTATAEAMVAEATDRVLTRSLDAGRG